MRLYIVEKLIENVMVLDLRGRITLGEETSALRGKVKQLAEAGYTRILFDLGEVTYIDSVGLSTLVASATTTRQKGGDLKLVRLTRRVQDLLQISRLSTVFEIYDDLSAAVRSFKT